MTAVKDYTVPDSISARTLEDMDKAISNFKAGNASETVDLSVNLTKRNFKKCGMS